jgi:hypothetical protein
MSPHRSAPAHSELESARLARSIADVAGVPNAIAADWVAAARKGALVASVLSHLSSATTAQC